MQDKASYLAGEKSALFRMFQVGGSCHKKPNS